MMLRNICWEVNRHQHTQLDEHNVFFLLALASSSSLEECGANTKNNKTSRERLTVTRESAPTWT